MLVTLFTVMSLVFLAELGDKTGLLVIVLASKSKRWGAVLLGALTGLGFMTLLGVVLGVLIEKLISHKIYIQLFGGLIFLSISLLMFWKKEENDENFEKTIKHESEEKIGWIKWFLNSTILIGSAEFLDKTQFVVVAMATNYNAVIVFVGAVLGFMAITLLEIIVGIKLGTTFSSKTINLLAAIIFSLVGAAMIFYSIKVIIY